MSFKKETEAFDRLSGNFDQAFKSGAFGLRDAFQIVPDIQTVATLLNTSEPELIKRFIAPQIPVGDEWTEEAEIPVTGDKVAKRRAN